jgi:hypothetical protein
VHKGQLAVLILGKAAAAGHQANGGNPRTPQEGPAAESSVRFLAYLIVHDTYFPQMKGECTPDSKK